MASTPPELESVTFLSNLGCYDESRHVFEKALRPHVGSFPVLIAYAFMLLEDKCYSEALQFLDEQPPGYDSFDDQCQLISMTKALAQAHVEHQRNQSTAKSDGSHKALHQAFNLAQSWHDGRRKGHGEKKGNNDSFNILEIQLLDIYLSIVVLATTGGHTLDMAYYQPPHQQHGNTGPWYGFISWCCQLNDRETFWDAQRIFVTLIPVLTPRETERLYHNCVNLNSPRSKSLAAAELVVVNAYLACVLNEQSDAKPRPAPSPQALEASKMAKNLLLYIFGARSKFKGAHYDEWNSLCSLLEKASEITTVKGRTALSIAAETGDVRTVKRLLEQNVAADSPDDNDRTALSWAAGCGRENIVRILLEYGGDPNTTDDKGQTPILWAAEIGHEGAVRLLLQHNADPTASSRRGESPLGWAAMRGHEGVVRLLLKNGADSNARNTEGRTPLSQAAEDGHVGIMQVLINAGSDPDARDRFSRSSLFWAAKHGQLGSVKLLVKNKADPDAGDTKGRTPMSWAAEKGRKDIVALLLKNTADRNAADQAVVLR